MYRHHAYYDSIRKAVDVFEMRANEHVPAIHKELVREAKQRIERIVSRMEEDRVGFCAQDFPRWSMMFKEAIVALSDLLLCCNVQPSVLPNFGKVSDRACPTSEFAMLDWLIDLVHAASEAAKAIGAEAHHPPTTTPPAFAIELEQWVSSGCKGELAIDTKELTAEQVNTFILNVVRAGFRCRLAHRSKHLVSTGMPVRCLHPHIFIERP